MTRLTLFIVAKALFNADVSGDARASPRPWRPFKR